MHISSPPHQVCPFKPAKLSTFSSPGTKIIHTFEMLSCCHLEFVHLRNRLHNNQLESRVIPFEQALQSQLLGKYLVLAFCAQEVTVPPKETDWIVVHINELSGHGLSLIIN